MTMEATTITKQESPTSRCHFPQDKGRIVSCLVNGILLAPGSLDPARPSWYCTTRSLFCLLGITITAANLVFIFTNNDGPHQKKAKMPESSSCPTEQGFDPPEIGNSNTTQPPSVIVDIAMGSSRFLGFFVNLLVRFGAVVAFPKVRQILHCLKNQDRTDLNGNKRWSRSWNMWTLHEKVYLVIIAISFGTRQVLSSGSHILRMLSSCTRRSWIAEILELIQEQSMVLFSLESAIEVATFLLLAFMGTFTHSQELECDLQENDAAVVVKGVSVHLEELFLNDPYTRKVRQAGRQTQRQQDIKIMATPAHVDSDGDGDRTREELERLLHAYFDMTAVWQHASSCTGFLTLLIFIDHTLSFCLNVFMALAALSRFGLGGHFCIAVVTASIIISKLICVAYMAQMLADATVKLADRVLELSWKRKHEATKTGDDDEDENLSQILEYVRRHPLTLSALGYFTVSKPTLTSISGVVVTYLVVLVQFHIQTLQQQSNQRG